MPKRNLKNGVNSARAFLLSGPNEELSGESSQAEMKSANRDGSFFSILRQWNAAWAGDRTVTQLTGEREDHDSSRTREWFEGDNYDAMGNPYLSRQDQRQRIETVNRQAIKPTPTPKPSVAPNTQDAASS